MKWGFLKGDVLPWCSEKQFPAYILLQERELAAVTSDSFNPDFEVSVPSLEDIFPTEETANSKTHEDQQKYKIFGLRWAPLIDEEIEAQRGGWTDLPKITQVALKVTGTQSESTCLEEAKFNLKPKLPVHASLPTSVGIDCVFFLISLLPASWCLILNRCSVNVRYTELN